MAAIDYKEYRYFKGEAKNPYPTGTVENALWQCEHQYYNKWTHGYNNMPYTEDGIRVDLYNHMQEALHTIPQKYNISMQEAGKAYYKDVAPLLKYYHWENSNPYKANTPASYFWLYEQDFIYRWACKLYNSNKEPAKAFDEFKQYLFNELLPDKWGGSPDYYKQQYKEGAN